MLVRVKNVQLFAFKSYGRRAPVIILRIAFFLLATKAVAACDAHNGSPHHRRVLSTTA